MNRARVSSLATLLLALTLQACVMVPRTTETYDPDCRLVSKRMDLQPLQLGAFQRCGGSECSAMLVAFGAVAAASVVVSGSIVVVGNVAYWLEERGRCNKAA